MAFREELRVSTGVAFSGWRESDWPSSEHPLD
jgi:hypothetical protein